MAASASHVMSVRTRLSLVSIFKFMSCFSAVCSGTTEASNEVVGNESVRRRTPGARGGGGWGRMSLQGMTGGSLHTHRTITLSRKECKISHSPWSCPVLLPRRLFPSLFSAPTP